MLDKDLIAALRLRMERLEKIYYALDLLYKFGLAIPECPHSRMLFEVFMDEKRLRGSGLGQVEASA